MIFKMRSNNRDTLTVLDLTLSPTIERCEAKSPRMSKSTLDYPKQYVPYQSLLKVIFEGIVQPVLEDGCSIYAVNT